MRVALSFLVLLSVSTGSVWAQLTAGSAGAADEGAVRPAKVDVGWSDTALAANLPPNFLDSTIDVNWQQAVSLDFAWDGRLFVGEKGGKVWVVEDGVKEALPVLDLSEEVGNWSDHGLLSVALHPDFASNGLLYALYVVDYHHATQFGTPGYDPDADELFVDTIARVTRYRVIGSGPQHAVDPASRKVLLGEDLTNGIPVCGGSHSVGTLTFGTDKSLLVSTGESAIFSQSNTCLSDGIIQPKEDVEQYRAQLLDSLSGKILRLHPGTGDGVRSNPYYDAFAPDSARSRVWTLGLRNPFRTLLRPGTGSLNPDLGDPGTLFVTDVGDITFEELSVVKAGGQNLGWPVYEGVVQHFHAATVLPNLDAENPLFDGAGCPDAHFTFQQLLVEDTQNVPSWPNPCDPGQQVPPDVPHFVHTRPILAYSHTSGTVIPVYDGFGEADTVAIDDPSSPVTGEPFTGRCAVAGAWYSGTAFPEPYQDGLFLADYNTRWLRFLTFDAADNLLSVEPFSSFAGAIVDMAVHPLDGSLYYINYNDFGTARLHRITYESANFPPVAAATVEPNYGPTPLHVQLDGSASFDPEGAAVSYSWDFGPGLPESVQASPVVVLPAEDVTSQGAIISRLDELVPPVPMGLGSSDPEVIRDGIYPDGLTGDFLDQFDTVHLDVNLLPDKNGVDWIGYEFPSDETFTALVFQEGINLDGGWFTAMLVQVRSGGTWTDVTGLQIVPAYPPGDTAQPWERFELRFDPATGDAIRLHGTPGGTFEFISVGELRVVALGGSRGPQSVDVTLTVTDDLAATGQAVVSVSLDNTPPLVSIVAPAQGESYPVGVAGPAQLVADVWDAEHGPSELSYEWQVTLHHNDHIHPGPILTDVSPETDIAGHGCDGDIHFTDVRLTVTDAAGLSSTDTIYLSPECDCDMNGQDDAVDLAANALLDFDGNGVLDACEVDCNGNGLPDPYEVFFGLVRDRDGNGVPDTCDPAANPIPGQPGHKDFPDHTVPTAGPGF